MWFKQGTEQSERRGPPSRPAAPSILSEDLKIEGDVVSQGELHVSGSIKGDVVARKLTLAEGGSITGAVEADVAIIAGNLAGRLTATTAVLGRTARVVADVTHVSLTIEQGAVFEGFSRRVDTIEAVAEDAIRTPRLAAPMPLGEAKPA
jgi:cytoskeletal protein CcmA (bactofilin family)